MDLFGLIAILFADLGIIFLAIGHWLHGGRLAQLEIAMQRHRGLP